MPRNEKKESGEKEGGKVGGKKAGKAAQAASRRMAETATDVFRYLEVRGKTGAQVVCQMEECDAVILAQITKNPGGGRMQVVLRDGEVPDAVRICKPLQVRGRANPKQFANIMRPGDVVVIVKGDIEGKLTPAQCERAQVAMERLGIPFTRGFFTSAPAEEAAEEEAFTFDRRAEAEAEEEAEESRQLEEARAWSIKWGAEVALTVEDIPRIKAEFAAKKARGGAGGASAPAEEEPAKPKGLVGFAALAAAASVKKEEAEAFSFE